MTTPAILRYDRNVLRALAAMSRPDRERIMDALVRLASTGHGDVKALKGEFRGTFRLRVGKWRVYLRTPEAPYLDVVGIDNRGEAY